MERADKKLFEKTSLRDEHAHRYQLAAGLIKGHVVDCASGIGYGSKILTANPLVESYLGIDPSFEAIQFAKDNFANSKIQFEIGTLEENSCVEASIDSFVMFETLEHTQVPIEAIKNVARVLKKGGLLIGSVPSADYEDLCSSIYGPNPFHLNKFTPDELRELILYHFEYVAIFSIEFILGSLLRPISAEQLNNISDSSIENKYSTSDAVNGSLLFIAGSKISVEDAIKKIGGCLKFIPSIPKALSDKEELIPLYECINNIEKMVRERDDLIKNNDILIADGKHTIGELQTKLIEYERIINEINPGVKKSFEILANSIKSYLYFYLKIKK